MGLRVSGRAMTAPYLDLESIIAVYKRVDMSTMVTWYASDIIEYDRRASELSHAPLHMT